MLSLFNQAVGEHPIERAIEVPRKDRWSARRGVEALNERPPVLLAPGQGEEDPEDEIFQRQEREGICAHTG